MSGLRIGGVAVVVLAVVSACTSQPVRGAGGSLPPAPVTVTAATPSPSASPTSPAANRGVSSESARTTPSEPVPARPAVGTVETLSVPTVQRPPPGRNADRSAVPSPTPPAPASPRPPTTTPPAPPPPPARPQPQPQPQPRPPPTTTLIPPAPNPIDPPPTVEAETDGGWRA